MEPTIEASDTREGEAYYWTEDATHVDQSEQGAPLRSILSWWLAAHGLQLIHAGAVGHTDGGVLLVGKGGAGKSSTALSCLISGMGYAGDDYVAIESERSYVHSLYNSAKVAPEAADTFRAILPSAGPSEGPKVLSFLNEFQPSAIRLGFPIRAILLPVLTNHPSTQLEPVSAGTALAAVAPSSILQLPGAGARAFEVMGRLVGEVPSYRLLLGGGRDEIGPIVARLCEVGG
jgi:hypothetical protein